MSLRKEMIIAIVLGLILGGIAAALFAQIPQNLFNQDGQNAQPSGANQPTPSPTPISDQSLSIEILFPEQQALIEEDEINVSGKTKPGAQVAITTAVDETLTVAENDGTFSAPVLLTEGANEIVIVSFDGKEEAEKIIVVNYTTEEL